MTLTLMTYMILTFKVNLGIVSSLVSST